MWTPRRFLTYLRWAWLFEGAAQYFSGQVSLYRPAVITRLREGERPRFPPSRRDAILLAARSSTCSTATAAPRRARCWRRACARRAPSAAWSSPSTPASARSSRPGAATSTRSSIRRASPAPTRCSTPASSPRRWTPKPSPLRSARAPEQAVDLHDLELETGEPGSTSTRSSRIRSRASRGSGAEPGCARRPRGSSTRPRPGLRRRRPSSASRAQPAARSSRSDDERSATTTAPRIQSASRAGDPIPGSEPGSGLGGSISASLSSFRACLVARLGNHHVARARGEEVGDVEAAGAAQDRGDALLEQDALDQLGVGQVACRPSP